MQDTIVAVATAPGHGAIGIVRLSGPLCRIIGQKLFISGNKNFTEFKPWRMHHGRIDDDQGRFVDDVLMVFMPGPGSFTGEDVLEIHGHGGPAILQRVVQQCVLRGARLAVRGEFSKRAFVNGRMDLTQAEAIMELIAAPTPVAMQLAGAKLDGLLGQWVRALRTQLDALRVQLCVAVDFPEDEIECLDPHVFAVSLSEIQSSLAALIANHDRCRIWQDGALVVLAGQVNAGKSSLMNAVLGVSRAIVTELPGTTRDYLEEHIQLDGLPVRLVDTAGLRESADTVEQLGMARSREMQNAADILLLVIDAELGPSQEDMVLAEQAKRMLVVVNKMDLMPEPPEWLRDAPWNAHEPGMISAKYGHGIEAMLARVRAMLVGADILPDSELAPNLRQKESLRRAADEVAALQAEIAHVPYDVLGVRLDLASSILAEITGEMTSQEVLERVFDGFCIGK